MTKHYLSQPFVFDYIKERIQKLPIVSLLSRLPIESGTVFTVMPSLPELGSARDLDRGPRFEGVSRLEMEMEFISAYLNEKRGAVALFESVFNEDDLKRAFSKIPYLILGGPNDPRPRYVCYFLERDARMDVVEDVVWAASRPPFLGILTTSAGEPPRAGDSITKEDLDQLASRTDFLLVGAFDWDVALFWSRGKST